MIHSIKVALCFRHSSSYICGGRPASAVRRARCQTTNASARGRKFFQIRCISWSYRKRGYEARIHKNTMDKMAALVIRLIVVSSGRVGMREAPRKREAERVFIKRMLAYSARKNRAKGPPAYSTLKPETSSDSPSVRSKGARFVSARVEMYHIAVSGHAGITSQIASWAVLNICSVNPPENKTRDRRISPRLTS